VSVESTVARIAQIQAMIGGPAAAPSAIPATGTQPASFQGELQRAQAAQSSGAAAGSGGALAGSVSQYDADIEAAAARHGVPAALLKGLIRAESNFNPSARSPAGALGLTQLMPGTAAGLGVTNALDPKQAIEGGAKYLGQQLRAFGGDVQKALAAYNAGPGAVQRFGGIPPYTETRNYVSRVLEYARGYGYGGVT
jgi:soluble lytic murein transglycosylase-like protein